MSDEPEKTTFDLFGMKVESSDFVRPDTIHFKGPLGEIHTIKNVFQDGVPVEQTRYHLNSFVPSIPDDHFVIDEEMMRMAKKLSTISEEMALRRMGLTTTTTTTTSDEKPLDLDEMMATMTEMLRHKRDQDKRLIESLLAVGMDVRITKGAARPQVILPEEYRAAAEELMAEARNRDPVENSYRDFLASGRLFL